MMIHPDIKKSKYSEGVYFLHDQEWKVGSRYQLLYPLGTGSFSSVCCAMDTHRQEKVALKRIPDILSSPELARRVLREICILRRLKHPFIIRLIDAFLTPSSTGQCKLINGQLQSTSLDCYLAMEVGEDGDLFNLKGQVSKEEVRILMWQMLHALKHLHALDIWHRDIKTSNVLVMKGTGHRLVKLADFGSSRSATQGGYQYAEQAPPEPQLGHLHMSVSNQVIQVEKAQHLRGETEGTCSAMDIDQQKDRAKPQDIFVQLGKNQAKGQGVGFCSPLTKVVATPCYRAPEVVMSRGGYTSAVDMWSLGCIMGELLQRIPKMGSSATPNLMVAPLFAIHAGIMKTPKLGERWNSGDGPGDLTTRSELLALFNVIGTPSWAEAEDVSSLEWRTYLQRLPGRAPSLFRRFEFAGEVAVHLLTRLLAFDPARRCTADEALQHEFFAGLESMDSVTAGIDVWAGSLVGGVEDVHIADDPPPRQDHIVEGLKSQVSAAWEYQVAKKRRSLDGPPISGPSGHGVNNGKQENQRGGDEPDINAYYTDPDAANVLAMLESEMTESDDPVLQIQHLRSLLEAECKAQALEAQKRKHRSSFTSPSGRNLRWGSGGTPKGGSTPKTLEGLQVDESQNIDQDKAALGRLNNVADTWNAKLDTAQHLKPGRHGEWCVRNDERASPSHVWGVSNTYPGLDPKLQDYIVKQQFR